MDPVSGKILGATEKAGYFFDNLRATSWPLVVVDVLIVAVLLFWAYLFLRETRAMRILYGLFFLLALMLLGRLMNLVLLNWILQYIMAMLVVAIPIVFQPELRNALERLGRTRFIKDFGRRTHLNVVNEVLSAVDILSKQKIGALIVFQRKTGLREYIERGADIDAIVSAEILLSIFFPKSPLHDGAVIIAGNKIVAASVTLPVSDFETTSKMGTRHRAGLGITENSDAVAIIVSEESGYISLAAEGEIERRIGSDRLSNRLNGLLRGNRK